MSLRIAYGSALKFLRGPLDSSQEDLGHPTDRPYISWLERGERSVTLDVNHSLAEALEVDPLTLLVVAYAAERGQKPRRVLDHLLDDLVATGLMESELPSLSSKALHPVNSCG